MLMEFSGVCQYCAAEVKLLALNDKPIGECSECNQSPFAIRKLKGMVYIVANSLQPGLVKIGFTRKTLEERIKSLENAGVAGKFIKIAIFPSDKPEADEKKIHERFRRQKFAKEHFQLEPIDAALGAYRALNKKRNPIFFDKNIEKVFYLKLEEDKIKMQIRLCGKNGSSNL